MVHGSVITKPKGAYDLTRNIVRVVVSLSVKFLFSSKTTLVDKGFTLLSVLSFSDPVNIVLAYSDQHAR